MARQTEVETKTMAAVCSDGMVEDYSTDEEP